MANVTMTTLQVTEQLQRAQQLLDEHRTAKQLVRLVRLSMVARADHVQQPRPVSGKAQSARVQVDTFCLWAVRRWNLLSSSSSRKAMHQPLQVHAQQTAVTAACAARLLGMIKESAPLYLTAAAAVAAAVTTRQATRVLQQTSCASSS